MLVCYRQLGLGEKTNYVGNSSTEDRSASVVFVYHHHLKNSRDSPRFSAIQRESANSCIGPFELTTVGSILELDECPGDESADDIPTNAADE